MSITVYYNISPRIIMVDAPDTDITIQDLLNQVRDVEDELSNLGYPKLIAGAGKEELGAGVQVGITSTLQNAQLMFEGRTVPLEDGTCTAADIGIILEASGGDFVASGVYKGCTVLNNTTDSMAAIYEVISGTKLKTFQITGGTRTTWEVGDEYKIYPNVQCSIDGGNLVAVDAVGNPIDVVLQSPNVQVIRSSSSSATNQELSAIQYSSFGGAVAINILNGVAGTAYNIGTLENPVNNIPDAITIANERGFEVFHIHGDLTLGAGHNVDGFEFMGHSPSKTEITIEDAASTIGCEFKEATIGGILDGDTVLDHCEVNTLSYVNGEIRNSRLAGPISLDGGANALFLDCGGVNPGVPPTIDMGGAGQSCIFHDYSGGLRFIDMTGDNQIRVQLDGGKVILDSTISAGKVIIVGIGLITDNSTGTCEVNTDGLLNKEQIVAATWTDVYINTTNGISGTAFPIGTFNNPVDNITDARVIAVSNNISRFHVAGNITLNDNFDGYIFSSDTPTSGVINLNNQSTLKTAFLYTGLTGIQNGQIHCRYCSLGLITNMEGNYFHSLITNNLDCKTGMCARFVECNCKEAIVYDLNLNGAAIFKMASSGVRLRVKNMTSVDAQCLKHGHGMLYGDPSNIAGTIKIGGEGEWIDEGVGAAVSVDDDTIRTTTADEVVDKNIIKSIDKKTKLIPGLL